MTPGRSRLVAVLTMMAAVLVAGSISASGAPAQDRPAVGGNVDSHPAETYDAVLPEAVPVAGNIASALAVSADSLAFGPDERGPSDDFALLFEANRWQQVPA